MKCQITHLYFGGLRLNWDDYDLYNQRCVPIRILYQLFTESVKYMVCKWHSLSINSATNPGYKGSMNTCFCWTDIIDFTIPFDSIGLVSENMKFIDFYLQIFLEHKNYGEQIEVIDFCRERKRKIDEI